MSKGFDQLSLHEMVASFFESTETGTETTFQDADETLVRHSAPWQVILYNDDIHTFDEVTVQLVKAIQCSFEEAERLAWQAHMKGKIPVYDGAMEKCLRVQSVLKEIALLTEIQG